jgi:hypothetical protein
MVRWRDEIGERRLHAGRGGSLSKTALGVAVFYLISLLLNGDALYRNAEQMPYGHVRDISLRLTQPLRFVSRTTGLYRIREWIEQTWNKEPAP